MKKKYAAWLFHALLLIGCVAGPDISRAQNSSAGSATVDGVKGVDKDAVANVKRVEKASVQSVNKVEGVKASSQAAATIRAVSGVSGINTAKMQNLEAALLMKEGGEVRPAGGGGGKGKAAAALLGGADEKPEKLIPNEDGRGRIQEFEKLENSGS